MMELKRRELGEEGKLGEWQGNDSYFWIRVCLLRVKGLSDARGY